MEKATDFLASIIIGIASVFLAKVILTSIGTQYEIEFFANLSWKDYWGASFIGMLYIMGITIRTNTKMDKSKHDFQLTIHSITHVLMMLFVWGVASGVNYLFF